MDATPFAKRSARAVAPRTKITVGRRRATSCSPPCDTVPHAGYCPSPPRVPGPWSWATAPPSMGYCSEKRGRPASDSGASARAESEQMERSAAPQLAITTRRSLQPPSCPLSERRHSALFLEPFSFSCTGLQAVSPDRLRRAQLRGVTVLRLHTNDIRDCVVGNGSRALDAQRRRAVTCERGGVPGRAAYG